MSEKNLPEREITITIKENSYKIPFPKTGQHIRIETLKADLSKGYYTALSMSSNDAFYAKLLIDTIATFSILVPELRKDLNVVDILELDMIDSKLLLEAYLNQYLPWYDKWMNIITAVSKNEEETTEEAK